MSLETSILKTLKSYLVLTTLIWRSL